MVKQDNSNHNNADEEWLTTALTRITAASDGDIDNQVNREILRYWNDRVRCAGDNVDDLRRIRIEIAQLIRDIP